VKPHPQRASSAPIRNPFATSATRPGDLAFHFHASNLSTATLIQRLQESNWWGEIVGPHGSGKSTLIHALIPEIESHARIVCHHTLGQRQRRLPEWSDRCRDWSMRHQVVVDGYEQLGAWNRWRLRRMCRRRSCGLLVTAHQTVGMPRIHTTSVTPELARQLVDRLLQDQEPLISRREVEDSFERQRGNLREVFFELYDLYEMRRRP
jgi:hypothetical protein